MSPLQKILAVPLVERTRRNHGLEHATITLLTQRQRGLSLVGRSTPNGFYLYGDVASEAVAQAAQDALDRMRAGERQLAIHPNCGTNFVTAGLAAALAAFLGFSGARGWRGRAERIPLVAALATLGLILAQPLGLALQRDVTTTGEMGALEIVGLVRSRPAGVPALFVATRG